MEASAEDLKRLASYIKELQEKRIEAAKKKAKDDAKSAASPGQEERQDPPNDQKKPPQWRDLSTEIYCPLTWSFFTPKQIKSFDQKNKQIFHFIKSLLVF